MAGVGDHRCRPLHLPQVPPLHEDVGPAARERRPRAGDEQLRRAPGAVPDPPLQGGVQAGPLARRPRELPPINAGQLQELDPAVAAHPQGAARRPGEEGGARAQLVAQPAGRAGFLDVILQIFFEHRDRLFHVSP